MDTPNDNPTTPTTNNNPNPSPSHIPFEVSVGLPTRLDKYLKHLFPNINQGLIEKFVRKKQVLLNGEPCQSSSRVNNADVLLISPGTMQQINKFKAPVALKKVAPKIHFSPAEVKLFKEMIIWEDDDLIVLNKHSGLAVQGGSGIKLSLDELAKNYNSHARLVHRIDKDTSGILIFAKTLPMAQYLTDAFKSQKVQKTYRAIVEGNVQEAHGTINLPIAKEKFGPDKEKVMVNGPNARPAQTKYMLRKKLGHIYSLLDCWPKSGRTHQLRVHLSASGWPILGDYKYGAKVSGKTMHLHAYKIEFAHPTGGKMVFTAPLNSHMLKTCKEFNVDLDKLDT